MSVRPLPPNAGPVLAVTPALLSFTATDGQNIKPTNADCQQSWFATIEVVADPGARAELPLVEGHNHQERFLLELPDH